MAELDQEPLAFDGRLVRSEGALSPGGSAPGQWIHEFTWVGHDLLHGIGMEAAQGGKRVALAAWPHTGVDYCRGSAFVVGLRQDESGL